MGGVLVCGAWAWEQGVPTKGTLRGIPFWKYARLLDPKSRVNPAFEISSFFLIVVVKKVNHNNSEESTDFVVRQTGVCFSAQLLSSRVSGQVACVPSHLWRCDGGVPQPFRVCVD